MKKKKYPVERMFILIMDAMENIKFKKPFPKR